MGSSDFFLLILCGVHKFFSEKLLQTQIKKSLFSKSKMRNQGARTKEGSLVERATLGEEVVSLIPAVAADSLLVGSMWV